MDKIVEVEVSPLYVRNADGSYAITFPVIAAPSEESVSIRPKIVQLSIAELERQYQESIKEKDNG